MHMHIAFVCDPWHWSSHCGNDEFCQEFHIEIKNQRTQRNDIQLTSCSLTEYCFSLNGKEYVPESLQDLLRQLHENPLYGHCGAAALYGLVNRNHWWPNCHKDCIKYARGCEACQRNNPSTPKPYGFLQPLPAPKRAFRHLTLEFVGPLPICKEEAMNFDTSCSGWPPNKKNVDNCPSKN